MEESRPFDLRVAPDRIVRGRLDFPVQPGRRPAVLVCHGFKGFMEWGFFPPLCELLTDRGFVTVRFNYSGSGMRPGDELVTDENAFRSATFSRDVEETQALLAAACFELAPERIDPAHVGLLGHSRGGGCSILAAAAAAEAVLPLRALVTWSAVATFDRLGVQEKKHWRSRGEITVTNARTGQELAIGAEVLEDLERYTADLDIPAAAARRRAPWLLIHGREDETVPSAEAERLARAAAAPRELLMIEGAGHTFGAVHPFAGPTPHLIEVFNATQTWFRRYLAE